MMVDAATQNGLGVSHTDPEAKMEFIKYRVEVEEPTPTGTCSSLTQRSSQRCTISSLSIIGINR